MTNSEQAIREFAAQRQQQPTAEGAEEILEAHASLIDPDSRVWYSKGQAIGMMHEFATLHAQRIADKMVSERLREELLKFNDWMDENHIPIMTKWIREGRAHTKDDYVFEYLKSRESHE